VENQNKLGRFFPDQPFKSSQRPSTCKVGYRVQCQVVQAVLSNIILVLESLSDENALAYFPLHY
jgi:hypothetical protein